MKGTFRKFVKRVTNFKKTCHSTKYVTKYVNKLKYKFLET